MDVATMTQETEANLSIDVSLGERSYPIHIGEKLLGDAGQWLRDAIPGDAAIIITDEHVARHYLHRLTGALGVVDIKCLSFIMSAGEGLKSWENLGDLIDKILTQSPDRNTAIIALGGGVIGDLAGVAASLVLRGLPFIQIPTTLLAQVDSSVGGKTGVNSSYGKNTIGSFYQPKAVLIDTTTLQTLPKRQVLAGYAEIIKYGIISDAEFFTWLLKHGEQVVAGDVELLNHAVATSCRIKAKIVAADETERTGMRAWLNFGHTYAHAFEAELGYGDKLLHGEAVAIGMVMALKLSAKLGHIDASIAQTLNNHLLGIGLRTSPKQVRDMWNVDSLMAHMMHDKKAENGKLAFVLAQSVGRVFTDKQVPEDAVRAVLAEELR